MTDRDALLAAVCANPDDDTVRLVFADWLDENGDPTRADFIRAQIEFARSTPGDPLHHYALWRNKRHEHTTAVELRATLPDLPGIEFGNFARGFVDDLHADDVRALRAAARRVFESFPVRSLRVRRLSEPAVLADTPELERVRRLNLLFCRLQVDTLRTVLGSPYLTNLVSLELDSNALPVAVVGVLEAAMGNLPRLRELWLGGNRLGDDGARHLARSTAFGQLHVLDLSHNGLHPAGAVALAESPRLTGLTRLILKGNGRWPREVVRALRDRFGGVEL